MRRLLSTLAYGFAGILLALSLSLGAFALAGRQIADPAEPVRSLVPKLAPTPHTTPKADRSPEEDRDHPRPTVSASAGRDGDDHEDEDSGSGSDDSGSQDSEDSPSQGSGSGDEPGDEHEDD
jgi:hypothetical protein